MGTSQEVYLWQVMMLDGFANDDDIFLCRKLRS